MRSQGVFDRVMGGMKWYAIVVLGGILFFGRSTGWVLHDVWCKVRRVEESEEYIISKSARRQWMLALLILLFGVIHVFNILLVVPIVMGLQHLMRKRLQRSEREEDNDRLKVKDIGRWYDGFVYAVGADPMFRKAREVIAKQIAKDSRVIDICCGTGALAFRIAEGCEHVTGVDQSLGMIEYAEEEKRNRGATDVEFIHADATDLSRYKNGVFDFAVLSFTLHEMPQNIRLPALREAARVADQVIIVDHMIPTPMNVTGMIDLYLEFNAGYDNFRDFVSFRDNGGVDGLVEDLGFSIQEETTVNHGTFRFLKTRESGN